MTTRGELRQIAAEGLVGATMVGSSVFTPLDWDTWDGQYPVIMVRAPHEDATSEGRGPPQFTTVATLEIVGRLAIDAPDDFTASLVAERQLEALEDQIKRAVINYPPLMQLLQQYSFIRASSGFSAQGEQHLAELKLQIGCEFYQGPEDFYPNPMVELTDARINDPAVFPGVVGEEADVPISQS